MSKTPWKKDEASTGSSDQHSLTAPADAGAAAAGAPSPEAADPVAAAVAKAVTKAKAPPKMVKMVRDTPMHPGGPTTADVPESEIGSWAAADWKVKKE